jgi:hypothetical protein
MSRDSVNVWDRFLAVLLMLGGILGIGLSVYMGMRMLRSADSHPDPARSQL